jgi:crossover junction endodeoxyribonuclease RuvC
MGISAKQFAEMEQRMRGKGKGSTASLEIASVPRLTAGTCVLGLDPSLRGTGWAIIASGTPPSAIAYGTIKNPAKWERSRCLMAISMKLREVLKQHPTTICAMEGLFFAQNLQTALIMGEARGAAIAAIAEAGLEIIELAPRKVKLAIVGYGGAQKLAVAKMVQRMLHLEELPDPDAADALALALAYCQETGRHSLSPPKRI